MILHYKHSFGKDMLRVNALMLLSGAQIWNVIIPISWFLFIFSFLFFSLFYSPSRLAGGMKGDPPSRRWSCWGHEERRATKLRINYGGQIVGPFGAWECDNAGLLWWYRRGRMAGGDIGAVRGRGAVGRREAGRMRKGNAWREMRLTKGGMCMSGKKCGLVTVLTEVDAKYVALTFWHSYPHLAINQRGNKAIIGLAK